MAKRKRYTDEFRAGAVLMYEANPNFVEVANHLKMPEATLRGWVNRHRELDKRPQGAMIDVELHDMKKSDFVESVSDLLNLHLRIAEDSIESATHHEVIGGIKILFDVNQLLTGGPTTNENRRVLVQYAD